MAERRQQHGKQYNSQQKKKIKNSFVFWNSNQIAYLDQECEHVVTEMRVCVVQVLDDAFGPLEALFAERPPTVQRHDRGQILQLHAFVRA